MGIDDWEGFVFLGRKENGNKEKESEETHARQMGRYYPFDNSSVERIAPVKTKEVVRTGCSFD